VSGPLVIIGGAEQRDRPGSVLLEFAGLCGRPPGTIAVCGEASADPSAMLEIYRAAFGQLGYDVEPLSAEDVATGAWSSRLDDAVGVFFTGGSQARLMENVGRSEFVDGLRRRWHEGCVIAGSSAGASAMGRVMIETGAARTKPSDAEVEIADGLGLVDAVIDQHFAERGRIHRLLAAVAASGCLGIGIDEDTAIVVRRRVQGRGDRFRLRRGRHRSTLREPDGADRWCTAHCRAGDRPRARGRRRLPSRRVPGRPPRRRSAVDRPTSS